MGSWMGRINHMGSWIMKCYSCGHRWDSLSPNWQKHRCSDGKAARIFKEPSRTLVDRETAQHIPGAKLDSGKIRPGLVLGGFARALREVSRVGTFGAAKYTENGWMQVERGEARYEDAQLRHWLESKIDQSHDSESELLHLAHEAWNALARLDLYIRRVEQNDN